MNIQQEELDLLRKACRGGNGDVADYLKYTGKDSICYADEIVRLVNAYEEANWSLRSALETVKHPMKRAVAALCYLAQRCGRAESKLCAKRKKCREFVAINDMRSTLDSDSLRVGDDIIRDAYRASAEMLKGGKSTRILEYMVKLCAAHEQRMCFKYSEPHNVLCGMAGQMAAARNSLGGQASENSYIDFFAKKLADIQFELFLKYGSRMGEECTPEGQLKLAVNAVEMNHDGDEYIYRR